MLIVSTLAFFIPYFMISYRSYNKPHLFFEKQGYENAIIEYSYIRKTYHTLVVFVGFFLVSLFYIAATKAAIPFPFEGDLGQERMVEVEFLFLYPIMISMWYFVRQGYDEEFNYYFAKSCFKVITEKNEALQKTHYLILGINSYDQYLRKNLKRHIRDIEQIYSRILSDSKSDKERTLKSITEAFESDDKLGPLAIYDIGSNFKNTDDLTLPYEPTAVLTSTSTKAPPTNKPARRFSIYDLSK